ncbi:glycosyl hydrolase family 28-related protein [Streptomyces sp. NPDC086554]|uniref:glycosyl hydrolase family 28-related protein n=1 Tax=Streptomyces sp. NPDC086554 TaxID=3154864 RepID=UPI00342EC69A
MSIPAAIPTVRVTAKYVGPDGRSLKGTVTFTGPGLLTFPESNLFIAGPVVASLDERGQVIDAAGNVGIRLPATDSPDMSPSGWAYTVKENLTGVTGARTYAMLLPKDTPGGMVDLADIAPSDPSTPNYVPVVGPEGPIGPEGALGPVGPPGPIGPQGVKGDPGNGSVDSVNGKLGPDVELTPEDVDALPKWGGQIDDGSLSLNSTAVGYRTLSFKTANVTRWAYQVSNSAETGADVGSNFELSNWSDAGVWKSSVLYGNRATGGLGVGTNTLATGAKLTVAGPVALRNAASPPAASSATAIVYSEAGQLKVVQSDGKRHTIGSTDGLIDVRVYGAKGDGTTDDAPAFRAALAALSAQGGGTLRVPGGTYLMNSAYGAWPAPCLYVRDNITFECSNGAVIRRGLTMGTARLVQNFDGTESNAGYAGHSNIRISGGTWDGNAPDKVDAGNMFAFAHAKNITLENVRVIDQPNNHAVELNAIDGARVVTCRFEGSVPKPGSPQTTEAIQIDGAFGDVGLEGGLPYDNTFSQNIVVEKCYTSASPKNGAWGALVGSHAGVAGGQYRRIIVVNNTIDDTLVYGIHAYDWYESQIANNTIYSTAPATYRSGVRVTSGKTKCDGVLVTGNVLNNTGGVGYGAIEVEQLSGATLAGGITISNNIVSAYSGDGLRVTADAPQINMNLIRAAKAGAVNGINIVEDGSHGNVSMNRVTGSVANVIPAGTIGGLNDPASINPA